MASITKLNPLVCLVCLATFAIFCVSADGNRSPSHSYVRGLARSKFPKDFFFGAASSAYQVEGAVAEDGRLPSVWDTFSHTEGKILDGSNGDVAVDHYHRYKEDIDLLKDMGMDVYRFSIAWTRIFPKGSSRNGPLNKEGIQHYNKVIDYTISKGLTPLVTIFHWDTPQALEDEYKSWLSSDIVKDYAEYAEVCFREFGDRVKHWATLNEPQIFSTLGYDIGLQAPGRCSAPFGNCAEGNSTTEPYIVAHNLLLAHSAAVKVYRSKYQKTQNGEIGIVLNINWVLPYSNKHKEAQQRALDFSVGWLMQPLTEGKYPQSMRTLVKERLPEFTDEESRDLKGSFDWIGVNYYSTSLVIDNPNPSQPRDYNLDSHANASFTVNGLTIGSAEGSAGFRSYPMGLRQLLNYFRTRYNNPRMYITETGYADTDNGALPLKDALNDTQRVKYHQDHLLNLLLAINKEGCNVHGYTVWSLLDSFEWSSGKNVRFGLHYVDYNDNLRRHPRASARWFRYILNR